MQAGGLKMQFCCISQENMFRSMTKTLKVSTIIYNYKQLYSLKFKFQKPIDNCRIIVTVKKKYQEKKQTEDFGEQEYQNWGLTEKQLKYLTAIITIEKNHFVIWIMKQISVYSLF